jgi:GNAT superfamily N-acetyltransferase
VLPILMVKYEDQYAEAFERLNRVWLERYDLFEEGDRKYLEHPQETVLAHGGEIFFALNGSEVVGTCAVIPRGEGMVELAKLAVADHFQGQGLGRRLTETGIAWARKQGAQKVVLVSSTKLRQALSLYEKLGFSYGPLPAETGYETADIYMELRLAPVCD